MNAIMHDWIPISTRSSNCALRYPTILHDERQRSLASFCLVNSEATGGHRLNHVLPHEHVKGPKKSLVESHDFALLNGHFDREDSCRRGLGCCDRRCDIMIINNIQAREPTQTFTDTDSEIHMLDTDDYILVAACVQIHSQISIPRFMTVNGAAISMMDGIQVVSMHACR
jgi:hypothetical protein